ncbi:MAG: MlaD family protein, partial [Candidatus Acidiferrum sp.]
MTRSLSRAQLIILGGIVLISCGLAVLSLFAIGGRWWLGRHAFTLRASCQSTGGVEIGTRVRVQGMDAGEVIEISPPRKAREPIILRLRLRGDFRRLLNGGSMVRIQTDGILSGKYLEIVPGLASVDAAPIQDNALLVSVPSADLADLLMQLQTLLAGIRDGEGTLGKLTRNQQAYDSLVTLLKQSADTMSTVQRDAEAIKHLPIIRGYVEDAAELLVRPSCEKNRKVFPEADLFEPGRAVLTASGRARLDELAPWLAGMKHKGSEIVVVSYADPRAAQSAA